MKSFHLGAVVAGCAIVLLTAGCETGPGRTAGKFAKVEVASAGADKGYVEFSTRQHESAVPIYRLDDHQRAEVLGIIGLFPGDWHRLSPEECDAPIAETLRIAVSPGRHTFILQKDGKAITVEVVEGKVTPVEIDYVVIEKGELAEVYRLSAVALDPVSPSE